MENLHKAMGVLYRPIKQKFEDMYLIEDYKGEDTDIMKSMPMDAVLSSIIFFYHLGMELSQAMMNSLQEEEIALLQQQISEENGDGINQFTLSLEKTYQELIKSQRFHYTSV